MLCCRRCFTDSNLSRYDIVDGNLFVARKFDQAPFFSSNFFSRATNFFLSAIHWEKKFTCPKRNHWTRGWWETCATWLMMGRTSIIAQYWTPRHELLSHIQDSPKKPQRQSFLFPFPNAAHLKLWYFETFKVDGNPPAMFPVSRKI